MPQERATGGRRRHLDDAEMRKVFTQIRHLLGALENPRGTVLNAAEVAEQLEALRLGRVQVVPAPAPKVVLEPWGNWTNLAEVPISALGLRQSIYNELRRARVTRVDLLIAHSHAGLQASGVHLGPKLKPLIDEQLKANNLALAENNSAVPVSYIIRHTTLRLYVGWTVEANLSFAEALGLQTMADVSRLTVEQICSVPWPDSISEGEPPSVTSMSPDNWEDVRRVVAAINLVLGRYKFVPIPIT